MCVYEVQSFLWLQFHLSEIENFDEEAALSRVQSSPTKSVVLERKQNPATVCF